MMNFKETIWNKIDVSFIINDLSYENNIKLNMVWPKLV